MKQYVEMSQWKDLSKKKATVLLEFGFSRNWHNFYPNISVGQMIEFLGDGWWNEVHCLYPEWLCDDLWKATKERLKNETMPHS